MRKSIIEKASKLQEPFWVVWSWSGRGNRTIHGVYQTEEQAATRAKKVPDYKYHYTQWEEVGFHNGNIVYINKGSA